MAFTRKELLDIADQASKAGNDADAAEAMRMLDELDATTRQQTIGDFENQSTLGKAGTALSDMLSAGVHGVTFGADDRAAAALHSLFSGSYDDALAEEQANTRARQARMEHVMPNSSGTFEALGSLAAPAGALKAGIMEVAPGTGRVVRGAADVMENAGYGAASAYGHGEDPRTGAAIGAGGTVLNPMLKYLTPEAIRTGIGVGSSYVGGSFGGLPGALWGYEAGKWAGRKAGQGAEYLMNTNAGRDSLAALAAAPGRLYGWATSGINN